ncbi:hypothetical protein RD110_17940 [Rhodoferax koreense]|uniref:diguanylate cyclase n=1 Tax=Rhodoferax koreensis TaxID=1842727 RepID=A0A1P8JYM5_9BURK|nr:GGDEF domain-containing protein [Rhodoferax koreense]APW38857.1 hypothetical protein RD110_17940 [Rhodoferax koreense]
MTETEIDSLTQVLLPNPGRELLRHMHHAAQVSDSTLAILYIDIDNFKRFNGHNGHLLGDEVLKELATLLKSQLDPKQIVFRIAGDEFVVILPEITTEDAKYLAQTICDIARRKLTPPQPTHCGDKPCQGPIKLTVSIGIATMRPDERSHLQLLQEAEDKMYEAKEAGRGRYVI